jgi:hypothetical protein
VLTLARLEDAGPGRDSIGIQGASRIGRGDFHVSPPHSPHLHLRIGSALLYLLPSYPPRVPPSPGGTQGTPAHTLTCQK